MLDELYVYRNRIAATDTLLFNFQEDLQAKMSDGWRGDSILPEMSWSDVELKRFHIHSIRRTFEKQLEKSLYNWVNLPEDEQQAIQTRILEQARTLAVNLVLERIFQLD